ncbi:hypothetical protein BDA96_04G296700 [Sorghum bicolor]|uniref:Secreted protein n=1 Tax=Sorghum bicolor TaxID=4558 RepID=A0A921UKP3_SORBI|nr:hypothetical protein BDA96_04G296700 [Sorghum bicolor]
MTRAISPVLSGALSLSLSLLSVNVCHNHQTNARTRCFISWLLAPPLAAAFSRSHLACYYLVGLPPQPAGHEKDVDDDDAERASWAA